MASKEFLLQLLSERASGVVVDRTVISEPTAPPPMETLYRQPIELSDTAFIMDEWGKSQGERLARRKDEIGIMADCYCALFEPQPELAPYCASPTRTEWFDNLMSTDDYTVLHATTECNPGTADIAAVELADQYHAYIASLPDGEQTIGDGSINHDIDLVRSLNRALKQAKENVADALDCAQGLGAEPDLDGRIDASQLAKNFKRVKRDHKLRDIFEMAGRFRCFARAAQNAKVKHGYDDLVGFKLDGIVPNLVSAELAKLADDDMELDLCRRLVERQAMCREYQGVEKQGQGPIIVYCDESGSMEGQRNIKSKALALTLGWIAQQQRRWIAFVSFTDRDEGRTLCMPPGQWDQDKLLDWISRFQGGGTELNCLTETLPGKYWDEFKTPKGKTDIIIITDGAVYTDREKIERFAKWKQKEQAKCFGLIIADSGGSLPAVCDRYWMVGDLSLMEDGVKEVLSI